MSFELINVGIADLKISFSPNILRTILGSCVGICIYDAKKKIGGMAHIMLPSAKKMGGNLKKYSETAIPLLINDMVEAGADRKNMTAKIAGGATMFKHVESSLMGEIGRNNIKSVKNILAENNIEVIAEDVGEDYGRTIDFYLETGELKVKTIGKDIITI
jgi:chemotaxis protein CheD